MKKLIILWLMLSTLTSCDPGLDGNKKDNRTELEKLPPLTTTGENTFGYLLNGKAIVVSSTARITAIYQKDNLQLGGGIKSASENLDITIFPPYPSLEESIPYDINKSARYYDFTKGCYYELEDTYTGYILFSKIDRINYIISGTFEFSTATNDCDTVRITDGRFDLQYIP